MADKPALKPSRRAKRWLRRAERWLPLLIVAGLALGFAVQLLENPGNIPSLENDPDGRQQLSFLYATWDSIRNHGEIPVWNPYMGGGVPWAGYLYNPGISVITPFAAIFGAAVGLKIWTVSIFLLAAFGMYRSTRLWLRMGRWPGLVATLVYITSHWLVCQLKSGNFDLLVLYLAPIGLYLLHRLLEARPIGLLLPILYSTAFAQAKYAPFILAMGYLPFALSWAGVRGKRLAWAMLVWCISFGIGVFLSFPKLLPLLELTRIDLVEQTNYSINDNYDDFYSFLGHLIMVEDFDELKDSRIIGVPAVMVVLAFFSLALRRRTLAPWWIVAVCSILFALADDSPIPLALWLRKLPIFETMNSFAKYFSVLVLMSICGLAAAGFHWGVLKIKGGVPWKGRAWVQPLALLVLVGAVFVPKYDELLDDMGDLFPDEPQEYEHRGFFQVANTALMGPPSRYRYIDVEEPRHPLDDMYNTISSGVGLITWYGNFVFAEHSIPRYLITGGVMRENRLYKGEGWADDPDRAPEDITFDYDGIRIEVPPGKATTVVLNMNHSDCWWADEGRVVERDGLLALEMPALEEREAVRLEYIDPRFRAGLLVAAVAALCWFAGVPAGWRMLSRRKALRALSA